MVRIFWGVIASFLLSGCTSVFFQPTRVRYPFVDQDRLPTEEMVFKSDDGTKLSAWYFSAVEAAKAHPELVSDDFKKHPEKARALIVQWHGNAENMTSHYRFLAWLTLHGYDLLTFDYRGYGASEGDKDPDGIYEDARAMIRHASELAKEKNLPLVFVGQSLGGSLLLKGLQEVHPDNLKLLVIEAAFYGHRQIAREKLASTWLTWPFQWLAFPLISDRYKPGGPGLKEIQPVPKILIYADGDPVIPVHHGEQLFSELGEPKEFWHVHAEGHVLGLFAEDGKFRKMFLERLASLTNGS